MRCTFDADVMLDNGQTASGEPEHFTLGGPVDGQIIDPRQELAIHMGGLSSIKNGNGDVGREVSGTEQAAEILG